MYSELSAAQTSLASELVSVVMPAHNAEQFVRQAAQSVLSQTYTLFELIIVDDNSRDKTREIAESMAARDTRVRVIQNEMNAGAARARNQGIAAASGAYIAFLDADDIWYPEKLRVQVGAMKRYAAAFSYTSYDFIDRSGQRIKVVHAPPQLTYSLMLGGNRVGCLTAMYSAAMLGKVFMPVGIRQEDYLTWMRILRTKVRTVGIPEVTAGYRKGHATLSSRKYVVASWQWEAYRKGLGLGLGKSALYMAKYAAYACLKHARR